MKKYPDDFFEWMKVNKSKVYQLLPTDPLYLKQYLNNEPIMDLLWWELGRHQTFEEMEYEKQKIYIMESIDKLFEEYTNDKGYRSPS